MSVTHLLQHDVANLSQSPLGLFGSKAYQDAMSKIVSVGIDDDYGAELPPTPDSEASREREEAQPEPTSEFESEDEMESKDELEDSSVFNDSQSDSVASDDDVDRPDSQRSTAKRAKAHVSADTAFPPVWNMLFHFTRCRSCAGQNSPLQYRV